MNQVQALEKNWPENNPYVDRYTFLTNLKVSYSMGWFVTDKLAMHTGGWYGTRTVVLKEFEHPLTIAIFLNSDSPFDKLINEAYNLANAYIKSTANTVYN